MAKSLENMLNNERQPCGRDPRDGYPFNDIGEWIYLYFLLYGHQALHLMEEKRARTAEVTVHQTSATAVSYTQSFTGASACPPASGARDILALLPGG
jgi:hypothetical protein